MEERREENEEEQNPVGIGLRITNPGRQQEEEKKWSFGRSVGRSALVAGPQIKRVHGNAQEEGRNEYEAAVIHPSFLPSFFSHIGGRGSLQSGDGQSFVDCQLSVRKLRVLPLSRDDAERARARLSS